METRWELTAVRVDRESMTFVMRGWRGARCLLTAEVELPPGDPDPEVSVEFSSSLRAAAVDYYARAEAARLLAHVYDYAAPVAGVEPTRAEPELDGPIIDVYGPDARVAVASFFGRDLLVAMKRGGRL
jgi:hypothetical protein